MKSCLHLFQRDGARLAGLRRPVSKNGQGLRGHHARKRPGPLGRAVAAVRLEDRVSRSFERCPKVGNSIGFVIHNEYGACGLFHLAAPVQRCLSDRQLVIHIVNNLLEVLYGQPQLIPRFFLQFDSQGVPGVPKIE